jgi:tripartite-type tricarboxylate transporter receptor subunit TctC
MTTHGHAPFDGHEHAAHRGMTGRLSVCLLTSAFCLGAPATWAEPFPGKPVRIVVPYPISGPTDVRGTPRMSRSYRMMAATAPPAISDILARTAAIALSAETPQRVVLERQPSTTTTRGAMAVARAAPDGHTLLLASNSTIVINPNFLHGIEYEPSRDFVPVAPLATMPFVLMAGSTVTAESPRELVKWLAVRPGEINYASSGDGSTGQLAGELFRRMTGVKVVHIAYASGVAGLSGLATQQVSLMFAALPAVLMFHPSEHFRPLAVTSARRFERLPEVPTLAESGVPGYEIEGWFGLFAPAGSPPGAAAWVRERVVATFSEPATRLELLSVGLDAPAMSFEQFATRINTELAKWAPILRAARLPAPGARDQRAVTGG